MPHAGFVPLRVFSSFTMLEGAIDPKKIAKQAKALGFPAAAITDRNGLYGSMAFSDACKGEGVQPIIGAMVGVSRPDRPANAAPVHDWIALYAQDAAGYDNLCALVSMAHLDRPVEEVPHISLDMLEGRTDGLIALTAGGEGALVRLFAEDQPAAALAYAKRLEALFPGRLYIEICRRFDPIEGKAEPELLDLAYARDLPLVATNPTCFAEPHFHEAHDVMLCIADSAYVETPDRRTSSPDAWMKPAAEMKRLFDDLPEALANTLVVAQRCAIAAPKRKPILPSLAGDIEGEAKMLREQATAGLEARLAKAGIADEEARKPYFERLKFETDIIIQMGFPGYFLIVADFIKWAKDHDIPVGPGRGSGAGSVVAWALTITDLDPLQLGLLFERFLNPERVSMPDFDIDFCETRRGEVIRYVQQKYGADHVAQIITFGKLKARAVLKDTGRVLQMSYGQVDRLAKLVPNHPTDPWTLERSLNGVAEFRAEYDNDAQVKRLIDYAMKLEGFPRHSSTHAAGVVIGDRPLSQLVPLYRDPRSDMPVTQFDMKYVEGAGLVKFDFLGLKTLSVLQKAVQLLAGRGVEIDLNSLGWDDPAVYELLQRGDTVGVFQLESEGMRKTLAAVRPTNFGDIIALVSLYRPGPMDNIPMFGRRKNGQEEIEYPHILLKPILEETYGIFVYQEQVMQAAQILAGYSLGDADLLRRAMGKKIKAEMDAQRARFVEGCAKSDIAAAKANELFDLIDKFAGYGFNKSHAAAYALLAYQTAWLKAHYPAEFYAASMAFDIHLTDKLTVFVDDMRRMGLTCLAPDINRSLADFSVEAVDCEGDDPRLGFAVRYALGGLKGVGEKAMEQLVAEREAGGSFKSLDDFADRIEPRLLNRRQLESLAAAGAFDGVHPDRAGVHAAAETILSVASSAAEARESGQGGLFGDVETPHADVRVPPHQTWSTADRMAQEKEAFGFYFSAHPVDRYRHLAEARGAKSYGAICAEPVAEGGRATGVMAAMVEDVRWRETRRGARYAAATFSDSSGQFQASCFDEDACKAIEDMAREGDCALLMVELDRLPGEETPRVTIRGIEPFRQLANNSRMELVVDVSDAAAIGALAQILASARGGRSEVFLRAPVGGGKAARLFLGDDYLIGADQVDSIATIAGLRIGSFERMEAKADGYRARNRRSGLRLVAG
ncbi:DNA polymerase III subunit alpha [Sphingobium indicum IP26]|uniref:DNA polymerase III subunit alpha n=1 Tax=Sphingobium indicum F2 TaxID=1450518 RepID=A0A8E1C2K4_9SPHN|nr:MULTISPECIES: DNA polymerase III subunit alpha [Sphingobium]EPR09699.1 DNA polymerase III subunit alpha [Sphingobium indicum IP26]EQB04888.1 DNA polymerase III subunit alpha [Sphingobium sp. HDIP04]KER36279.1 DNA polymerase III subunit alpha [Sphingobium indicum F2]KER38271.1 DNA polymerase III subunit alpha [Sphingobium indicum F2]